ncbi:sirohydrochlorin chelatase [Stieleria sp. TO1_6]|uniref:sirohydrochlorin chelatase n=1 Tax=Stieleria tagensis TaxID=2956795 RepID=UPI00209B5524|nr:sirohydrochlorin chelatase [Stieleria tagensis]MCO8122390.1 sirohydrochlorin chelatase [Stieleria tagensis]
MAEQPDGILLIGHGTRDAEGTREFFQLADLLAKCLYPHPVAGCLLEFQQPTIAEGWRSLVDQGVRHVRVAPLLLFAAGHARQDIPRAIVACAAETPGVTHSQSGPLSRAPSIIRLLGDRIEQAAAESDMSLGRETALVAVGRGSYDPCAQADMQVLGQVVARRAGLIHHAVGFYAMAQPRLPDVLDRVASRPEVRQVIVQPHLLFQGRLYDAIVQQVDQAAQRHRQVRFVVGRYLGPNEAVAQAVARRVLVGPEPVVVS